MHSMIYIYYMGIVGMVLYIIHLCMLRYVKQLLGMYQFRMSNVKIS